MLFSGTEKPQKLLIPVGSVLDPHLIRGFLDPHESAPNGISIVSAVLAQHVRVTSTQTDRPRYVRHR